MNTFKDIFKSSFLEEWLNFQVDDITVAETLIITALIALYIFFVYRLISRRGFYSKTFNIALFAVSLITSAIVIAIQSNVVVSLGMVGALSIVRFRTAIKDPMDLTFLFWSISVGIICGARQPDIAIILSFGLTVCIVLLDLIPNVRASMLLIVNCSDITMEDKCTELVKANCKYYKVKARNVLPTKMELTYEVRTGSGDSLVQEINKLENITSVALISHDGEVTY